jgi:glycosyltransferase involved in cell wall biosynthesis
MVVQNCPYARDPRVRNEAKALAAAGYHVTVICPSQGNEPLRNTVDNITIYRFPAWRGAKGTLGYVVEYAAAMLAITVLTVVVLVREGFDIIHVANPPDCIVPLLSIYKLMRKSIVYDQHDLCLELYEAKFGRANHLISKLLLLLEQYSYRLADHVIVTNESCKEIAIQRGRLQESQVTVVRNGPDLTNYNTVDVDRELRRTSPNIITFAGVIGIQDGLDHLCRALDYVRHDLGRNDFYCFVLGDGDALQVIKTLAQDLRIDDKMWFAGWIGDTDTYTRYISISDICVSPGPLNSYNERSTFIKIMEYMAAGKPIVAYDLLETRRSAQAAALYAHPNDVRDFGDKVARLMDNPVLRRSMGETGLRQIHERLAWKYSAENLLKAYQAVIKSSELLSLAGINEVAREPRVLSSDHRRM